MDESVNSHLDNAVVCRLRRLYVAAHELMADLGAEGIISTEHRAVALVMNALYDLDEGQFDIEKVFGK